jgi:hypothetical protein
MPKNKKVHEGCVNSGVNSSTKAQRKKIDKGNFDLSLPEVNYSDIYMYVNKKWNHKGKSCMLCNTLMNDQFVLDNHHYVCQVNIFKQKHKGLD